MDNDAGGGAKPGQALQPGTSPLELEDVPRRYIRDVRILAGRVAGERQHLARFPKAPHFELFRS